MGSEESSVMTDSESGDDKVLPFEKLKQKQQRSTASGSAKPQTPPPGQGKDSEGLGVGFWRENGAIWTATGPKRRPVPLCLCSDMRAIHTESSPDGRSWALNVDVIDPRGVHKPAYLSRAMAETEPAKCMSVLVDAGLVVYAD